MNLKLALFPAILLLTGCTGLNTVAQAATGSVASVAPQAMQTAEKALIASHALHEAAADALTIAAKSGACHAACASQAKTFLDTSEAYLVAADKLVALGDAPGIEAKIAGATALISQVQSLTSGK